MKPFLCLLLTASPATALELSTLDAPVDGSTPASYNQWLASSFIASSDALDAFVSNVKIEVACSVPNANVFVAILGSISGRPNMDDIRIIMDTTPLTTPVHLGEPYVFTLEPKPDQGPPLLVADQQYWVVFGATAPDFEEGSPAGLYAWSFTNSSGPFTSQEGWSLGSQISSGDTIGQNWTSEVNTPYLFGVSLTSVPEPTSALSLAVSAGLLLRRKRNYLS